MGNMYYKIVYHGKYLKKIIWVIRVLIAVCVNTLTKKYQKRYSGAWIVGAGDDRYENNIKVFYEYLRGKKPQQKIYWVVDANKKDRIPVDSSMLVNRGSIKNYLIAINSSIGLITDSDTNIAPGLYRIVKHRRTWIMHLDHGICGLKGMAKGFWNELVFDGMCCFSEFEKKIKHELGIPEEKLFVTGSAHSDDYEIRPLNMPIKSILIMPTWRDYYINGDKNYEKTQMFKVYKSLFNNQVFKELCRINGIAVTFILHPALDNYFKIDIDDLKEKNGGWVEIIAGGQGNMHNKIANCDMLITDYSSLLWDFIYMNRPVLMYAFDWDEYEKKRGIMIKKEKTGRCLCERQEDLISMVKEIVKGNRDFGQMDMIKNYFTYRDKANCDRIFKTIIKMTTEQFIGK